MVATIKRLMDGRHGMSGRLLDVGSGYGFFSREAVTNDFRVVAIELAENEFWQSATHHSSGKRTLYLSTGSLEFFHSQGFNHAS
jgi:2-polyprenyl-3-methyl-5-hydroxy-6-metoxy-1,4-benzoquinol methylase